MIIPIMIINSRILNMTIFMGILEVLIGFFIYFLTMFLIKGIKKEDLYILKKILNENRLFQKFLSKKSFMKTNKKEKDDLTQIS
jgi:hypothetical protein